MNNEYDQRMGWEKLLPVWDEPGWLPHRRRGGVGIAFLDTEPPFLTSECIISYPLLFAGCTAR